MMRWLTNNLGLKVLALALAVALWLYVQGELARMRHGGSISLLDHGQMECAAMPVHPRLAGEPARGCRMDLERVVVEPSSLLVVGGAQRLGYAGGLWTEPIDVSGVSGSVVRRAKVVLGDGGILGGGRAVMVTVTVPVEQR